MGKGMKIGLGIIAFLVVITIIFVASIKNIYNNLIQLDESTNQTWSEVQSQYQRRYDLIPNLVSTVKGYAAHEKETLEGVTEARAKLGGVTQLSAKDLTPENLAKFQEAQANLSGALQRLMVVTERYPELKANQNFMNLQDELSGTENRITVARRRFNEAVQSYNQTIRQIPQMFIANFMGLQPKGYFEADATAQSAPKVEF